jgi:hypothetical protein
MMRRFWRRRPEDTCGKPWYPSLARSPGPAETGAEPFG